MRAIRRRLHEDSHLAHTARGQIEYATWGSGPAVLIVHGAGGGYDQGQMIAYLLGEDFYNIAVSRFGYLRSPLPPDASPQAQADLFAALLDYLGLDEVIILAASAGGPAAVYFALRHADRCSAILLVSAITENYSVAYKDLPRGVKIILHSDFLTWLLLRLGRFYMAPFFGVRQDFWRKLNHQEKTWLKQYWFSLLPLSERWEGIVNELATLPNLPPLPLTELSVPTLIIHAVDDTTVPVSHAYHAAGSIPDAQLNLIPDGGHLLIGHQREAQERAITFLNQVIQYGKIVPC